MPDNYFDYATAPLVDIYYDDVVWLPDYSFMNTLVKNNKIQDN